MLLRNVASIPVVISPCISSI